MKPNVSSSLRNRPKRKRQADKAGWLVGGDGLLHCAAPTAQLDEEARVVVGLEQGALDLQQAKQLCGHAHGLGAAGVDEEGELGEAPGGELHRDAQPDAVVGAEAGGVDKLWSDGGVAEGEIGGVLAVDKVCGEVKLGHRHALAHLSHERSHGVTK